MGSNAGMIGMAKEHLGLALALNLPVMCVVTKIDMTPPNVMKETLSVLGKLLRSSGVRKLPLLVQEHKHAGKNCPLISFQYIQLKIDLFELE